MFPSNGDFRLCLLGHFWPKQFECHWKWGMFFLVERFNGDRDDHPWVPHVWSHAGHFPVESQDSRHRGSLGTAVPGVGGDETKWNIVKPIKRPTLFFLYLWAVWEYLLLRPKMGCYPKACRWGLSELTIKGMQTQHISHCHLTMGKLFSGELS